MTGVGGESGFVGFGLGSCALTFPLLVRVTDVILDRTTQTAGQHCRDGFVSLMLCDQHSRWVGVFRSGIRLKSDPHRRLP